MTSSTANLLKKDWGGGAASCWNHLLFLCVSCYLHIAHCKGSALWLGASAPTGAAMLCADHAAKLARTAADEAKGPAASKALLDVCLAAKAEAGAVPCR